MVVVKCPNYRQHFKLAFHREMWVPRSGFMFKIVWVKYFIKIEKLIFYSNANVTFLLVLF